MRDSGLDISYALRKEAIEQQNTSYKNAVQNGFVVGKYDELIPQADLVLNLTPDKQHTKVVSNIMPLMKKGATLSYSHGFNIVEEGMQIREDITVIMVAPKCPGTEVREEYKRGFGVPTLIATDPEYIGGRYTGKIAGTPSFKHGKVLRVNDWLAGMDKKISDFDESYFYSDSINDLPLLEVVTHPIVTNPSPSLLQVAEQRNWPVLNLFSKLADHKS